MTRTQAQQAAVLLLLILFGVILWRTRPIRLPFLQGGPAGEVRPRVSTPVPAAEPANSGPGADPAAAPAPTPEESSPPAPARNPFDLPAPLSQLLQEKTRTQQKPQQGIPDAGPNTRIAPPNLRLEGLFWGVARPQAIINRRILAVGDEIDGARITAITPDGVTLKFNGADLTLRRSEGMPSQDSSGSQGLVRP